MLFFPRNLAVSSIATLAILNLSTAFYIDSSCSQNGVDVNKLKLVIDGAFSWAKLVVDNPNDPKLDYAKQYIFGDNIAISHGGTNDKKWDRALSHFFALLSESGKPQTQSQTPDELRFYCDTSRLSVEDDPDNPENPTGKKTWDPATQSHMYGDGVANCDPNAYKAYVTPSRVLIQLCPWYLQQTGFVKNAGSVKFNTVDQFFGMLGNRLQKGLQKAIPKSLSSAPPLDALALPTHTILHEMMHTRLAGLAADTHGDNSYGWESVHTTRNDEDSWNNAESLAFYGMAAYITNKGKKITGAGDVLYITS